MKLTKEECNILFDKYINEIINLTTDDFESLKLDKDNFNTVHQKINRLYFILNRYKSLLKV